jgi:hypothetical protein
VVQLFEDTYHLTEAGSIEIRRDAMHQGGRVESVGAHFAKHGTANGHPGLAWAARADWLRTYGFEDSHVTTGGDVSMVRAFTQLPDPCNFYRDASAGFMNWMGRWAEPVSQAVDRRFAFVPGTILHLWHGPTGERRYRERWRALMDNAFDPATDLVIDPNGLWAWSDAARAAKPRMIEAVAALVGR